MWPVGRHLFIRGIGCSDTIDFLIWKLFKKIKNKKKKISRQHNFIKVTTN